MKIARHRNHFVFSLRCRDDGITPPSLKIKCGMKTQNGRDIIKKDEKDLIRERIRLINNKLGKNFKQIFKMATGKQT